MVFNFGGGPTPAPAGGGAPAFNLGASAAPGAHVAGSAPGFNFAANAAPAAANTPATAQPTGAAPLPSFGGFGAGAPQPAAPTAPAGFGATAAPANAPAVSGNTGAPAPSFAFGSTASNTPAPGPVNAPPPTTATPAPVATPGGISFGGATTPAATPGPSLVGAFGTTPAAATTPGTSLTGGFSLTGTAPGAATTTALAPAAPVGYEVPAFDSIFPNERIHADIKRLLAVSASPGEEGREAASELVDKLRCDNSSNNNSVGNLLALPTCLQYTGPDQNLRNQLGNKPEFVRYGKAARLEPEMLQEIFKVADDLRISEKEALSLCCEVMQTDFIPQLESKLDSSIIDQAMSSGNGVSTGPVVLRNNAVKAAKELYFFERQRRLRTILMLVQSRIEAAGQPWGDLIIQATDSLLQNKLIENLIKLIREWTILIGHIERKLAQGESANTSNAYPGYSQKNKKAQFDFVHLAFAMRERQSASESLFFIAYHTQLTASEVAGLIDITKDLSSGLEDDASGLPVFNPFHHVPSSFETPPQASQTWTPYQSSMAPLKEKGHLEWQRELTKKVGSTGKCELLRLISTLVMTIISALDTRNTFSDRNTHRDNDIGVGNMLLPTGQQPGAELDPIHQRLTSAGCSAWKRTDICGLLCGAYAMLLKPQSSLSSPRKTATSPSKGPRSLVRTFAECLSAPMLLKSITFAQLCLLPALQRPSNYSGAKCETSEFLLSVLSEFVANFMDVLSSSGNLPRSRTRWKKDELERIQLDRDNQKQQRDFKMWAGSYNQGTTEAEVRTSVNLLERPDCMDDVVALAIAVASQGAEYAMKFWEVSSKIDEAGNSVDTPVPSRAYKQLKALAAEDDSLTPFYIAYSAALAKADCPYSHVSGADAVNSILSSPDSSVVNWSSVFETLRWYFHMLGNSNTSTANVTRSSGAPSTSYYYQNTATTSSSVGGSSKSASASKPAEIGDTNTFYLLSLLGLVSSVSAKSPKSRLEILSLKLPIKNQNSSTVLGSDPTLNILFSLLTGPLPPEVRGATLAATARLLSTEGLNENEKTKMREFATSAWMLVESCQILPIMLLDQYPQGMGGATPNASGLNFPASSVSLAGSGTKANPFVPLDQAFAILYEMVHVESKRGTYPSTEGFLSLLVALIRCCCPATLGQGMRLRLGCTPYVEYVAHFVLPMITGSGGSKMGKLPFRSKADEARLFAKATEVIKTVLFQYSIASFPSVAQASQLLGQEALAAEVIVSDPASSTGNSLEDFASKSINSGQQGMQSPPPMSQNVRGASPSSVPSPKSPGFVVLSDLLAASDGSILKSLAAVLVNNLSAFAAAGDEASKLAETYALFKETPPTLVSAKHAGKNDTISDSTRAQLLKGLRPNVEESLGYSMAVYWLECGIVNALKILCAAAVREEVFCKTVYAATTPIRVVPVLRFDKSPGSHQIISNTVQLSRFQDVLQAAREVVYSLTDYVGYSATTDETDVSIAASGLSLIYYFHQTLPGPQRMVAICRNGLGGPKKLSYAIAQRLVTSFERKSAADFDMLSLVFNWMVSSLRRGDSSLSHVLLGLDDIDAGRGTLTVMETGSEDCFGAILNMLNRLTFLIDADTSKFAALCFEILVRISDLKRVGDPTALRKAIKCSERLRAVGFWRKHLGVFLAQESTLLQSAHATGDANVLHSMAWTLQGIASELHLMTGFSPAQNGAPGLIDYITPRIGESNSLLSLLFAPDCQGIENIIRHIPIQSDGDLTSAPPQDAVRFAQRQLDGPPEFTDGYMVVEETTLLSKVKLSAENESRRYGYQNWCKTWNLKVKMDCATFHLSNTLRVLVGAALVSCEAADNGARVTSMASLLAAVLERLIDVSPHAQVSPMTARGLSFIAMMLSRDVASVARNSKIGMADLRTIRDLLARSVIASGRAPSGAGKSLLQERIAILGAALVEVMQVLPREETEVDERLFLDVAVILAEHSAMVNLGEVSPVPGQPTMDIGGRKIALPTEATMVARSCLVNLFEVVDQEANSPGDSLAFTLLSERRGLGNNETCAKLLLRRVALLDEGITVLIEKLLQGPFVGNLMIEEGLLESLSAAAETYMHEEWEQQNRSQQQQNSGQRVAIGFPAFLHKHLLLFRTLFATGDTMLSEQHRRNLPARFFDILQIYEAVFSRAFGAMSQHSQELCVLAECVAQASSLRSNTSNGSLNNPLQPVMAARNHGNFVESAIQDLCLHIGEHIFPCDTSAQLPYSLSARKDTSPQPSAILTTSNVTNSWWESKAANASKASGIVSAIENWTEATFSHALVGVEILYSGLAVVVKGPLKNFVVEMSLVRGFFQLSRAAQSVEDTLGLLFDTVPQLDFMETDTTNNAKSSVSHDLQVYYLRNIGRRLNRCIHMVLLALVHKVKRLKVEPENLAQSASAYCKGISDALEIVETESQGIPCSVGAEETFRSKQLATILKQLCASPNYGSSVSPPASAVYR